jgi:uncharacterized protein YndB with AHSA1/START domain
MIRKSVRLPRSPDEAFRLFTESASDWWPEERRHTGDAHSQIRMLASGRFWERASDGHEVELGRVRVWEPPHRMVLDFYPGSDAEHPTQVVVTFVGEGGGTLVTVEHGPTAVSEEIWKQRAPRFAESWDRVLRALAAAAARIPS